MNKLLVIIAFLFFVFVNIQQTISCMNVTDNDIKQVQMETRNRAIQSGTYME